MVGEKNFLIKSILFLSVFSSCTFGQSGLDDLQSPEVVDDESQEQSRQDKLALCKNEKNLQLSLASAALKDFHARAITAGQEFYANTASEELQQNHYKANAAYSCAEEVARVLEAMSVECFSPGTDLYKNEFERLWEKKYSNNN